MQNRGIIALGPVSRPYIQIQIYTKPLFFHYLPSAIVQERVLVQEFVLGTVLAFGVRMHQMGHTLIYVLESNNKQ